MARQAWASCVLLAVAVVLVAAVLMVRSPRAAQAQASEGKADSVIAVATPCADGNLLYLIDTSREVILVYGFHTPGPAKTQDMRNGAFEFLAGRLYRWDVLLATKQEYSMRGVRTLGGLRPFGPGSSEEQYKRAGE